VADDMEKTEEPTQKKIDDARKEGNVPKSMDFAGFIGMAGALMAAVALGAFMLEGLGGGIRHYFGRIGQPINDTELFSMIYNATLESLYLILPISVLILVAGVLGNLAQFGFIFTTKPLVPDIKKIDPIKGMKNLFSMKKVVEALKITAKTAVSMGVGGYIFLAYIKELPEVGRFDFIDQLEWLLEKSLIIAAVMLIVFFAFGVLDLAIVRYQYFKQLRMSKNEIKDEYKNTEGNPEVKARIRRLQRQMANNRMMADVPKADVVITNPTHFAVAIQYDAVDSPVPKVLAKGADNIALKIKEIAREHGIQIYENQQLARELYKKVDVGGYIPQEMYQAVAEVLAFVYKTNKRGGK